ncbi:MAG: 16S rRNA (uracil(1498)-N(3))-methyltransferase [Rhodospirillaceae bacterium]|nr:16S rRNA (uracil(1498)-N(3))-methyltransferase [Rhodospirillaceae bacterium]|tara:strand:+ start:2036 stop:2764 length:729 start_codon:yes stop_codon:yes gene_type:complete
MRRDGRPVPRLHVTSPLGEGVAVALTDNQSHYLARVLRLKQGDGVRLFNGRDGEWLAAVESGAVHCREHLRFQTETMGPWLVFAPPKRDRLRFLVEKATELGVSRLMPVTTARTEPPAARADKMLGWAVEAAEQCCRLDVPICDEQCDLEAVLEGWTGDRRLLFCDESGGGKAVTEALQGDIAVLVGPEGGFSATERDRLMAMVTVVPVSLGSNILRIETASVAALAAWQVSHDGSCSNSLN